MVCNICGKEFVSRRKDARFCSAKCRVKAGRVTDPVTDKVVTDNVTDRIDSLGQKCIKYEDGWIDQKGYHMCAQDGCPYIALDYNHLQDKNRSPYCWKHQKEHTPPKVSKVRETPKESLIKSPEVK